jgi:hypothetical protein
MRMGRRVLMGTPTSGGNHNTPELLPYGKERKLHTPSSPGHRPRSSFPEGMHRQGYDLQLTQYDDRGWRAIFTPQAWNIGTFADERDGHRVGAHAVAGDATGGVGGAQPRERLTTLRNLLARLPRRTRFWRRTEWVLYRFVRDGSQE